MNRVSEYFYLWCVLLLVLAGVLPANEPLHVGVAETVITPPDGFPMAGYYHERLATGTLDPLKAKAIVFRDSHEQAALVVCDLTGVAIDLAHEVRKRVADKTGIRAANVVVSATHSHTAPDYSKHLYDHLASSKSGEALVNEYPAKLIDSIVNAVIQAHAAAKPAIVEAGTAIQKEPISFNRRFVMKDGSVKTWMRLDDPNVVRAAGPIDPEVGLLRVLSPDGLQTLGVLTNFALHLDTVGGTQWSGDYPFHLEQSLRRSLGEKVVSVFGTGCCGDINHVDPLKKDRNKAEFIGQSLAQTVEASLPALARVGQPRLRVRGTTVMLPLQEVSPEQIARSQPLVTEARAGKQIEFFTLVTAYKSLILDQLRNKPPQAKSADFLSWGLTRDWAGIGSSLPAEVQVFTLGNEVALVFLPGEVFVDLGLAIKRASPYRTTLIIELSNCVETVYIPHRAAYAGGSYEVTNSNLQPGGGEMLVEAALRLLREAASEQ